jgi:hypothetical protein
MIELQSLISRLRFHVPLSSRAEPSAPTIDEDLHRVPVRIANRDGRECVVGGRSKSIITLLDRLAKNRDCNKRSRPN